MLFIEPPGPPLVPRPAWAGSNWRAGFRLMLRSGVSLLMAKSRPPVGPKSKSALPPTTDIPRPTLDFCF